ncbi:MAG: hypothetical protein WBG22_11090 [Rhodanobacter sp.]
MIFRESLLPRSARDLADVIAVTMLYAPRRQFPHYMDFDGAFYGAATGVERLRKRFGDAMANQLLDMLAQAKAHYEAGDNRLGGALMEDTKTLVRGRQPWAYPKELYRWSLGLSFPELTESDLLRML